MTKVETQVDIRVEVHKVEERICATPTTGGVRCQSPAWFIVYRHCRSSTHRACGQLIQSVSATAKFLRKMRQCSNASLIDAKLVTAIQAERKNAR